MRRLTVSALGAGALIAAAAVVLEIALVWSLASPESRVSRIEAHASPWAPAAAATETPTPRLVYGPELVDEAIVFEDPAPPLEVLVEAASVSSTESTPVPTPRYVTTGVEQWRELVASIFPAHNVERVLRVMRCESSGNPDATGAAGERGLMQIHPLHADSTYDPTGNLLAAARISDYGRTFAAWDGPTPGRGEREAEGGECGR